MTKKKIRIGTRGSPLALKQTEIVIEKLKQTSFVRSSNYEFDIVPIKTSGDLFLDRPLQDIGGKGLFIKEIEEALLQKIIDFAVHSMKDIPAFLPEGLSINCVLEREDPRDVLIASTDLMSLAKNTVIGTSSLRRKTQLLKHRPDLIVKPLRGNINTRLKKIKSGEFDGTILAAAGLKRMGFLKDDMELLSFEVMIPAIAQGIIGIEARDDDKEINDLLKSIHHEDTFLTAQAERQLLIELGGSCRVPIAGFAEIDSNRLFLKGYFASEDGKDIVEAEYEGEKSQALNIGLNVAHQIKKRLA